MIDRAWYMDVISRAILAFQQDLAMAVSRGTIRSDKPFQLKMEGFSNKLRDELRFALDHDDIQDFTPRLQSFVDEMIDLWAASTNFRDEETDITIVSSGSVANPLKREDQRGDGMGEQVPSDPSC